MRRSSLLSIALLALAVSAPSMASAQLVDNNMCAIPAFNWGTGVSYVDCIGRVSGNNEGNANPGQDATLWELNNSWGSYGDWVEVNGGTTNAGQTSGPFSSVPGGTSGVLTFDNALQGYFVLGLKSSNGFSLYLLNATSLSGSVNFSTAGVTGQGLSHATLYSGGVGVTCVGTNAQCVTITTTPEPSTYALMGAGLLTIGFVSRRRRQA